MTFIGRKDLGHNKPGYVFKSPCCQLAEVVSAWVVAATVDAGGRLRLRCGRTATDPLRAAGTGRTGCGRVFEIDCRNLDQR